MISINDNISALKALGTKLAVSANNIANIESEGFKKSEAILKEGKNNSVKVDINKIDTPGDIVYTLKDGQLIERELSNVDLAEEIPKTMTTQRHFEANLKAIEIHNEMLGSVLDIIG